MHQLNKFFIRFWLTFAIASLVYACYMVYVKGWQDGAPNFVIAIIAFVWWGVRKFMTKRLDKQLQEKQNQSN